MALHLIFDLGGTLISDPFEATLKRISAAEFRGELESMLDATAVEDFLSRWASENREHNFSNAGHFLQEEVFIARAAWPDYQGGRIRSRALFPLWTARLLHTYREIALAVIAEQPQLPKVLSALQTAKRLGHRLSVASNDRFGSAAAMLAAAGLLDLFDVIATSEGLGFSVAGAEKPSAIFFEALAATAELNFADRQTLYIGDDETRDVLGTKSLPLRSVRYFGNSSAPTIWLDNTAGTAADFSFSDWGEFEVMVAAGAFEQREETTS